MFPSIRLDLCFQNLVFLKTRNNDQMSMTDVAHKRSAKMGGFFRGQYRITSTRGLKGSFLDPEIGIKVSFLSAARKRNRA
jgi:hypothetical protein